MKHSRVWPISLSLWPSISVTRKESPFVLLFVLIILNPRQAEVIPFLSVACRQHINPLIQFLSAAVAWANVLSYCRENELEASACEYSEDTCDLYFCYSCRF